MRLPQEGIIHSFQHVMFNHQQDKFSDRHIGPSQADVKDMLSGMGLTSIEELIHQVVPSHLKRKIPMNLPAPESEYDASVTLKSLASQNRVSRSLLGLGYSDCIVPPVIQRNILENPGWYTQYTPYQAEIAQGRLEALLNFQTLVTDLTGMDIANASLLDESTAAAEAMSMLFSRRKDKNRKCIWVDQAVSPQTLDVIRTRALPLGIAVVSDAFENLADKGEIFAAVLAYPGVDGAIPDLEKHVRSLKEDGIRVVVVADILALTLLHPPGKFGVDVVVGSAQRFGQPLGFGGPHAAFFAARDEFKRILPGRIVGVSIDKEGRKAYRLALQTREQHIRREKATSNICTAQVLLAILASMYAVYHGPSGLRQIATRIHRIASGFARAVESAGLTIVNQRFFDTVTIKGGKSDWDAHSIVKHFAASGINIRVAAHVENAIIVAFDEKSNWDECRDMLELLGAGTGAGDAVVQDHEGLPFIPASLRRLDDILTHPVFHSYRSETEMLRYIKRLESRDLSLAYSMIPLGSCTMKLNATSQMFPVSWPEWNGLHPFAPAEEWNGYRQLFEDLENWLCQITGFAGVSLQPNAGSQGEFAGLLAIREYHLAKGDDHRNVCLIPTSAHGTNPASAVMAGMKVVGVKCDDDGNIDIEDLKQRAEEHAETLSALMVTYPSTHGVFEESIADICEIIHQHGGQVYMDGANLNALVGLCSPSEFGADVCHINLHKTFCIPHGGGGPGMGPIAVAKHLVPHLPGHWTSEQSEKGSGAVAAAPFSSASILVIPWMYMKTMGADGLTWATQIAILNANYLAHKLNSFFPVLYKGNNGRVAHECILDLRHFNKISVEDVAKRLMDYGFHAPTVSWPVANTLMVEPTESESLAELDRFCEAMISIAGEIDQVEKGLVNPEDSPLKNAPHTATQISSDAWNRPYSRDTAVFPLDWIRHHKFWPSVARIDNVYGDRNPVCTCPSVEEMAES